MDAKSEAAADRDAERHAEEFRSEHGISQEEWDRAEAYASAFQKECLRLFWEAYDG